MYISLANIAARGYGARPGAHAYFSAKQRRNSVTFFSRANATFYYERRRARARSVEPKRPSASIFCPRQRVSSFSPPLIPRRRGRPLRGAQASRCISLVQLCLVSTRKKNCAVGREKNFLKGEKRSYRGARTKIKKGGKGKERRALPRAAALFPSTGYRNVNEPRHLPPSAAATGPLRRAETRIAACLCSRHNFCRATLTSTDQRGYARPTRDVILSDFHKPRTRPALE